MRRSNFRVSKIISSTWRSNKSWMFCIRYVFIFWLYILSAWEKKQALNIAGSYWRVHSHHFGWFLCKNSFVWNFFICRFIAQIWNSHVNCAAAMNDERWLQSFYRLNGSLLLSSSWARLLFQQYMVIYVSSQFLRFTQKILEIQISFIILLEHQCQKSLHKIHFIFFFLVLRNVFFLFC